MAKITDESIDNAIAFIESGEGEKRPGLQSQWVLEALRELKQLRCDHKFVDSNYCLKCGWNPLQM